MLQNLIMVVGPVPDTRVYGDDKDVDDESNGD